MFLLTAVQAGFNGGDVLFQLIMFMILLSIPLAILLLFLFRRKRNDRLKRVEEKLDKLIEVIADKENKKL